MELEVFVVLSAGGAGEVGLLDQGALEVVCLLHVDGVEADVEEEADEDEPEDSGTGPGGDYEEGGQGYRLVEEPLLG
jgi:hypothetical protein